MSPHVRIPVIKIPQSAKPNRTAAKRDRAIAQDTEADRLRQETALGLAAELDRKADEGEQHSVNALVVSLARRRSRAIRELVELSGGPPIL